MQILSGIQNSSLQHSVLKQEFGEILRLFTAAKNRNSHISKWKKAKYFGFGGGGAIWLHILSNSLQEVTEFGGAGKPMVGVFPCPL